MLAHVLHRGDLFAGRYRVERCIGSGGMGAVYEAEHVETERRIALKVLLPQALVSDGARERFQQEVRVAAKIRHPNIVDVLDAGVDDLTSTPYLAMELLHGEDLGSRLARAGRMSPLEAVALLSEAASALDCLHEKQIVHRDLKPENLFLARGSDGRRTLKLLDFGVAKVIAEGNTSAFTQDAQGTPVYMAPEQFAEQIRISPATDIYALGMLAFTLLTGKQYWGLEVERGMNVFMLARIAEGGPREPATKRARREGAELPAAFDEWFSIITALTPGERYPTAGDAIEALADTLQIDPRAAARAYADLDRSDPPFSGRGPATSSRAAIDAVPGRSGPPYTSTPSPTSGLQSTPPIPLRRALRRSTRARVLAAALVATVFAIGITVAFRVVQRGSGEGPSASVAPVSSGSITISTGSSSSPEIPSSPIAADKPPIADPSATAADPSPSASPSSSILPRPAVTRPPPRAPASSATTTRKPKYTRD